MKILIVAEHVRSGQALREALKDQRDEPLVLKLTARETSSGSGHDLAKFTTESAIERRSR